MNFAGRDWLERYGNSDVCSFWTHSIPPHSLWDLLTSCIIQVSRCWALGICLSPETHCPASQGWCAPCLQQSDFVDCLNAIKPKSCWPDLITCCLALLQCLSSELLKVVYKQLIKAWNSLLRRYGDTNFHFYFLWSRERFLKRGFQGWTQNRRFSSLSQNLRACVMSPGLQNFGPCPRDPKIVP